MLSIKLKDRNIKIKAIEKEFSNRMIVIDEVHNIRIIYDEQQKNMKKTSNNFLNLVNYYLRYLKTIPNSFFAILEQRQYLKHSELQELFLKKKRLL